MIAAAAAPFARIGRKLVRDEMSQQTGNDQSGNPKSHAIGDVHATWLRR
jgi:hypothetical protein